MDVWWCAWQCSVIVSMARPESRHGSQDPAELSILGV